MGLGSVIGSIAGALIGGKSNKDAADQNAALQREFAQQGIRWKVEDAKAAGIHPLYALGANTVAANPSYVGDTGMANAMSSIGQNIDRSIEATRTRNERVQERMSSLQLERGELENDLLRSQIARLNSGTGPAFPASNDTPVIDGQGDAYPSSGRVIPQPATPVYSAPGNAAREAGEVTDYGYARTDTGLTLVPSSDVKDRIEDAFIPELQWSMRNLHLLPPRRKPPADMLPSGYDEWVWHPVSQEFRPTRRSDSKWRHFINN